MLKRCCNIDLTYIIISQLIFLSSDDNGVICEFEIQFILQNHVAF